MKKKSVMKPLICQDRSKVSLGIITLSFVLLAFITGLSQTAATNSGEWTRIESVSKDFSVALPSGDYLTYNENGRANIWYEEHGRSFAVNMEKGDWAKGRFKAWSDPNRDTSSDQVIKLGDFIGRWYTQTSEKTGTQYYWFQFASSHGWYSVSVRVPKDDSEIAQRFIRSIRLKGKPIIKGVAPDTSESQTVRVDTYKTSDLFKQALKEQPNAKDLRLEEYSGPLGPTRIDSTIYSRDLMILEKPRPSYTDEARMHNITGTVRLRVTFLADGTIGAIKVAKSLDKGLDRQTFEAAKRMKFVPAEIDGKPVDIEQYVEYTFSIY